MALQARAIQTEQASMLAHPPSSRRVRQGTDGAG